MKVKGSNYIKSNKPLFKKLVDELLKEYEYVTLLAQDGNGKNYAVSKSGITITSDSRVLVQRGFVVKVYSEGCFAEYSGNSISEEEIGKIVSRIKTDLVTLEKDADKSSYKIPEDEAVVFEKSTEYEIDPDEMGDEAIVTRLKEVFDKGISMDERVLNCNVRADYQKYSKLFLSKNKDLEQNVMYTTGAVMVMTLKGEEVKMGYGPFSGLCGMELLKRYDDVLESTVKTAIELLDSEPLPPGEYECICDPATTGMIVHEAFGHGVEMDMFVKDRALAKYNIGEYVASPLITMHDGPDLDDTATFFFDDEGTLCKDTVIIDKGVLVTGMSDLQSAGALGTEPTGNGRRQDYMRKAYTRMTNTYFEPGKDKLEDMIASVKDGLLLQEPSSGMEDPKNWGIQCMVTLAREIKDGKLTGRIFSPIILTGYVPDLLKSITMVSDEAEECGTGYCGKGYKEWVKVSDGGPYIKARIRLG
ncbi:MAG: TldD/PmbA family protein [Lachnospiraceae bacterium]|nr:TldD/PmbA family protein [Lachnospiraceae bacterium]